MENDLVNSINSISSNMQEITNAVKSFAGHWWSNPFFSSLITAVTAVFVTLLVEEARDYFKKRNKKLRKLYLHFVKERDMGLIFYRASITSYGHTSTTNGKTEVVPEKKFSEKLLIEFRQVYKHWNLPYSRLRFLLQNYEKKIKYLPDIRSEEIKETKEYEDLKLIMRKIVRLSEKKTGEDAWSIRNTPEE